MTKGYVSDVEDDDTVMDQPQVTVTIDLSQLNAPQAFALAQQAGLDQFHPYLIGELMQGNDRATDDLNDASFHLPLGPALTALAQLGVVELPEQPPDNPEKLVDDVEADNE